MTEGWILISFSFHFFVIVQFKIFWTIKKPQITAFDRVQPHKCQYGHEWQIKIFLDWTFLVKNDQQREQNDHSVFVWEGVTLSLRLF